MPGDTFHGPAAVQSGGHHNVQINYQGGAPRPAISWPHQVGVIPQRAEAFQDRGERSRLRAGTTDGGTAVLAQVLSGMGGVGKTQLAADYAEEVWDTGAVDLLVWVTATSRDAVETAFARAGADVCGADPASPQRACETFLAWLRTGRRRWLVVLDDIADPKDLAGLWPPAVPHGRTVATTRRRDAALAGGGRRIVEVGVFTPDEAVTYLTSVLATRGRAEPAAELGSLAMDLGHLPLALSQAAAYLVDAGIRVAAYRELLARRARTLADVSPDVLPDDQMHTMAASWELSVDYADRLRPCGLARPMLELTAFLAPNGIPASVLTSTFAGLFLAGHRTSPHAGAEEHGTARAPVAVPADDAAAALRALHRLSLVTAPGAADEGAAGPGGVAAEGRMVRVHQIVQRATRDRLPSERFERAVTAVAYALVEVWPEVERDTGLADALRACAAALISCADECRERDAHRGSGGRDGSGQHWERDASGGRAGSLYRGRLHPVLYRLGRSVGESGQVAAALRYFRQLTTLAERRFGADHPDTLLARGHCAQWRGETGDVAGAVAAYGELLDDMARVLGPGHPEVSAARSNLAFWRGEAGDVAGAVAASTELLRDVVRLRGPDHPFTLNARHNLAFWRGQAGDAAGAAAAFAALLADRLRVLGPDHRDTLITRGNLAGWREKAGDEAGADEAFAEVLADQTRVLGPDHPDTLTTRSTLAGHRGQAGDAGGAAAAFAALLADRLRVLGPDHPDTVSTLGHLAHWRAEAGDTRGVAEALAEVLADRLRDLAPGHPDAPALRDAVVSLRQRAPRTGPA
ncbi:tetratricopeptide repeat protein [Actinacidiphila acidipaludis]|uniref:Tetratricopeptide repeat protein n=1 Tax=Actinacidiphila acidipaludis TaxID=2873382 RepID=A0ABS7QC45_9ACTN|nr:tetratricopeptide repeat protein [Streptomyces acidipaludis]MBY8879557.1 tetratricopeptide repeat protein [Streptomyces acidipaludis]